MSSLQDKFNTIKAEVIAWGGGSHERARIAQGLGTNFWELPKQWARDLKLWNYVTEPGLYLQVQ